MSTHSNEVVNEALRRTAIKKVSAQREPLPSDCGLGQGCWGEAAGLAPQAFVRIFGGGTSEGSRHLWSPAGHLAKSVNGAGP